MSKYDTFKVSEVSGQRTETSGSTQNTSGSTIVPSAANPYDAVPEIDFAPESTECSLTKTKCKT